MKAVVLANVNQLEIADRPTPDCPDDALLIRVEACGISAADVNIRRNGHPMIQPPRVLGHEIAGTIVEVGANVHGYYDTERVVVASAVPCGYCYSCRCGWETVCDNPAAIGYTCDGGLAEYMLVPAPAVRSGCVNKIADGVTVDEAVLAEPLACCLNAQELCRVGLGKTVAIIGAGPIGCMHALVARAAGAARVILADVDKRRLADCQKFSKATRYVHSAVEDMVSVVQNMTDGRGADVVIVGCPEAKAMEDALRLAAKRGVVNLFASLPGGRSSVALDTTVLHEREVAVVGNHDASPTHYMTALSLIAAGSISVKHLITHVFSLDEALDAFDTAERREGLKVVVHP